MIPETRWLTAGGLALAVSVGLLAGCYATPPEDAETTPLHQPGYGASGRWIAEFNGSFDRDNASAVLRSLGVDVVDENAVWVRGDLGELRLMLSPNASQDYWRFIGSVSALGLHPSQEEALAALAVVKDDQEPVYFDILASYENRTGSYHAGNVTWEEGVFTR